MKVCFRVVLSFAAALLVAAPVLAQTATAQPAAPQVRPYAQGLLWKIEGPGPSAATSHLFGTMHVADPRVITLPAAVRQAFDAAATFTVEVRFDPANVLQLANRMIYTDGRELPAVIGAPLYDKVVALAPALGLPPEALRRFKPWAVALLLIVPQKDAENILDNKLYQMALAQKKLIHQLETVDEQVDGFESMAESEQIAFLSYAVDNHNRLPARMNRMVDAYVKRDLAELLRISEEDIGEDAALKRLHAALMHRLLDERNVRMAERMEPMLKTGRTFFAVGALHLYGERGILARLANRGYRVSRVY